MNAAVLLAVCSLSLIEGVCLPKGESPMRSDSILPAQMVDSNMLTSKGWRDIEFCREYAAELAKRDGRPEGQTYQLGANPKLCFAFIDRNPDVFEEWQKRRATEARRFYCSLLNEKSPSWNACKKEFGDPR